MVLGNHGPPGLRMGHSLSTLLPLHPRSLCLGPEEGEQEGQQGRLGMEGERPCPITNQEYSLSGGKGVSPDLGVTGSDSSGAKPRAASSSRAIGNFTCLPLFPEG